MGLFWVSNPHLRSQAIGNTHQRKKKSEKRGDELKREINSAEHQSEKLILQDFLRCEMKNVEMKSEEANGDVYLEILIEMEFNYKIFNVGILNWGWEHFYCRN